MQGGRVQQDFQRIVAGTRQEAPISFVEMLQPSNRPQLAQAAESRKAMTAEEIVALCDERASEWYTIAPKYRTAEKLGCHILDTVIKVLQSESDEMGELLRAVQKARP